MKYLKLYEDFDWSEEDFDFEEEFINFKYVKVDGTLDWIYVLINDTLFDNYDVRHLKGRINFIPLTGNDIKKIKDKNLLIHFYNSVHHTVLRYYDFIQKFPQFTL